MALAQKSKYLLLKSDRFYIASIRQPLLPTVYGVLPAARFIKTAFSGKGGSVCAKSAKVLISLYMKNSLFPYLIKGKG